MTYVVVAPTKAQAEAAITAQGLGIWSPQIVTDPVKLPGYKGTILVYNRRFLDLPMQEMLSLLGQRCMVVEMAEVDKPNEITQAPWEALALELVRRGVKRVTFRDDTRMQDFILTIKDALEPPEFETAEEALAWLDRATERVAAGSTAPAGQLDSAPPAAASSLLWPP